MLSPAERSRLDRIEEKLDLLLVKLGATVSNKSDNFASVLATGGIDALKSYVKNGGKA